MIELLGVSLALLVLSVAMLGIAYFTWRMARQLFSVAIVIDTIFFFVFVKLTLYYFMPAVLRIGSGFQFEREDRVAIVDLARLYAIELISWCAWSLALLCVLRLVRGGRKLTLEAFCAHRYSESKSLLLVITLGFIVLQATTLTGIEGGPLFEVFKSLFFYAGVATGPFLMAVALRYHGKMMFALGVSASVLALLSLSTRGAIVYLALFTLFLVWFVLRDRASKAIVATAVLALCVSYFALGGLFGGSLVIDDSGKASVDVRVRSDKLDNRSTLAEIEWRFGASTRMGTAFLNLYDRGDSAGINPILHSLQGFLPRAIDPDKPQPSTLRGDDIYSQGMYIVSREINRYDTTSMVEFPTGAHFYWEFGVPGVLVLSAISGCYVALCAFFFTRLGMVALPLMLAVFKPWGYVDPKIWVSDIAMQIYQIILPLIVLVFFLRFMRSAFRMLAHTGSPADRASPR